MSASRAVTTDTAALTAALLDVVAVMDTLRGPGGCPWDAEQTHTSLARYAIEEAHEVGEAAAVADSRPDDAGAQHALAEELGDLLLQVLFHARIAQERDAFALTEVAATLAAKLRRRHPHVFGEVDASDADAVRAMWEDIKAAERAGRGEESAPSVLDGVPESLPALMRAQKVLSRARRAEIAVGPDPDAAPDDVAADVGAELLAVVARAQALGVDAESALRGQVRSVVAQVHEAEGREAEGREAGGRPGSE